MKELFARLETEAKVISLNSEKVSGHLSFDNQSAYLGNKQTMKKIFTMKYLISQVQGCGTGSYH